ncbi:hypothetical protein XENTR_v10018204 [Xenopus tropicalis]|nr:hypothetical protein XENTR_v10018204 [Xenopus tropicalis]
MKSNLRKEAALKPLCLKLDFQQGLSCINDSVVQTFPASQGHFMLLCQVQFRDPGISPVREGLAWNSNIL